MGYVIIGENILGNPEEGSQKAVEADLAVRCDFCNEPAPSTVAASYWTCPTCHAVK